jgi:pyruvate kinase
MKPKILITLGPSSLNERVISQISDESIYLFRINLSHTSIDQVEKKISEIRKYTKVPICLDSEGAQIRNQHMKDGVVKFKKGAEVKIHFEEVLGDSENLSFSHPQSEDLFQLNDIINIDFNSAQIKITNVNNDHCMANVVIGGNVGSNKAANIINRTIHLNPVTEKDIKAIQIGKEMGICNFALSFANRAEDVELFRKLVGPNTSIISKIESINALHNLLGIIQASDEILIDRGDLSREVNLEKIPFLQRRIISITRNNLKPVYVATNLLESMIHEKEPTRAEINDVVSTLLMGANGLVLAAETAIGIDPINSVKMIKKLITQYLRWTPNSSIDEILMS